MSYYEECLRQISKETIGKQIVSLAREENKHPKPKGVEARMLRARIESWGQLMSKKYRNQPPKGVE